MSYYTDTTDAQNIRLIDDVSTSVTPCNGYRVYSDGSVNHFESTAHEWERSRRMKQYYSGPRVKGQDHNAYWFFRAKKNPETRYSIVYPGNGSVDYVGPVTYCYRLPSFSVPNVPSSVIQEAILALRTGLSDQKFNASVCIGEMRETIGMVAQAATTIANAARHIKKGRFGKAAKELGMDPKKFGTNARNAWLQYRYGITPLINDVGSVVAALADRYDRQEDVVHYRVKKEWSHTQVCPKLSDDAQHLSGTLTRDFSVIYDCTMRVTGKGRRDLNQLGFVNPAVVAWELIPLSFVVDWFIPIGDYLDSLSATVGLDFISGYETQKDRTRCTAGDYEEVWTAYNRTILSSCPTLNFPTVNVSITMKRLADAIALLTGTLK